MDCMWSLRKFILWFDALLLIIFLLCLSPRMTGLPLHETLGIVLFIPIVVHLLLSWSWIRNAFAAFMSASVRGKVNLIINTLLFILMMIEIISGLVISEVAVPFFDIHTINDRTWRALHNLTLNYTVLLVGLHIAMNWRWITNAIQKNIPQPFRLAPTALKGLARVTIVIVVTLTEGVVIYLLLGPPSPERLYAQDEIARFVPTVGHGIGQFAGETFLVAMVAYVGNRWLKVRL